MSSIISLYCVASSTLTPSGFICGISQSIERILLHFSTTISFSTTSVATAIVLAEELPTRKMYWPCSII